MKTIITILAVALISISLLFIFKQNSDLPAVTHNETDSEEVSLPSDSNNESTTISDSLDLLIGTWVSEDDMNFTRTFNIDGTILDSYRGSEMTTADTGGWSIVSDLPEAYADVDIAAEMIIKIDFAGMDESMYFPITVLTATELEKINYSGIGNILRFKKE